MNIGWPRISEPILPGLIDSAGRLIRCRANEYAGDLHAELAKNGFLGICMYIFLPDYSRCHFADLAVFRPESLGGVGLGISEAAFMLEAISESGAGVAGAQTIHANVYATVPGSSKAEQSGAGPLSKLTRTPADFSCPVRF
jgi:hypothetical protein